MKTILTFLLVTLSALAYAQETPPPLPDPLSEEANAVQATLLAKAPPLTNTEKAFILAVQAKIEGVTTQQAINMAFYNAHLNHFADKAATFGTDPAAWTSQLIEESPTGALAFINKPNCWNATIATAVYAKLKGTGYATLTWRKAFKKHRRTLSLAVQVEDTAAEVATLTSLTDRTADQNLWMAELTLDLAALQIANANQ
jgi:hypothetical protein